MTIDEGIESTPWCDVQLHGVLYFDDVEHEFNASTVDDGGRVLQPGGSQAMLAEAIEAWFPAGGR
jgi:hypothetical protein